jgi:hypothetical protein
VEFICTAAARTPGNVSCGAVHPTLPVRFEDGADGALPPGLVVPPRRMPLALGGRPLKRWCYVGAFGERVMLCAAVAWIGPLPQAFWAVWDRERGALRERTRLRRARGHVSVDPGHIRVRDGSVAIDARVEPGRAVQTASPHGDGWIWTRKQGGVRVHGQVRVAGETIELDARGCVDQSAGYHARVTDWEWSAGVGRSADGRDLAWNLVTGVHDAPQDSERTLWVDGEPRELEPVKFAADLGAVSFAGGGELTFEEEACRRRRDDLLVVRSDYIQPFGAFSGTLPGGIELAEGRGVMERHHACW